MASDDRTAILEQVRAIAHEVAAPLAEEIDREARWPQEALEALQTAGLGGLVVPTTQGGLGHGMAALTEVCEILGQACPSTALSFGMHCVGSAVIAAKATSYHQERYLASICEGRHLTTLALSEPGSGAHFYMPQTELEQLPSDEFRVRGVKTFVTNGGHADSYVISTVAADPSAPPGQFSCLVLPGETPGLIWGPPWAGLGMRGNSSRSLTISGAVVPRANLLGEEGDEIWYMFTVIAPFFLIAMAGSYLGIAQGALDEARQHLIARSYAHSGGLLAQQSVLQHRFGVLWAQVERTRQLIYAAARAADQNDPTALPLLTSAKAEVAECAVSVVNEAMTLMGGIAYRESGRMSRLLRDARAAHVMAPTTDLLRLWTGRTLLDQPLLAD